MREWIFSDSQDGTRIPLQPFHGKGEARAALLLLPALGVQARFYRRLAEGLADAGITTYLFEQRGHGESPVRAGRGERFGYKSFLENDIPAAIARVKKEVGGLPLYLGGHSLGGHMSSIIAGRRGDIAGVLHLACGFPYHKLYGKASERKIKILCRLLPIVTLACGYFPGNRFGFGGREYRQLMMDWREWALGGSYDIKAIPSAEADIAAFKGPVLSLAFERDTFASAEAVQYSVSRFKNAKITTRTLGEAEQGRYLGHFDWAKAPSGAAREIVNWIG